MKFYIEPGVEVELSSVDGVLQLNGKPAKVQELGGGLLLASTNFTRTIGPGKASSRRKRKKALMRATKAYNFSFKYFKG